MAQLAIAGLGTVLSMAAGFGPGPGFLAGAMLGRMLFGPDNTVEGPRLNDTRTLASCYGRPIHWVEGEARVGGDVIWVRRYNDGMPYLEVLVPALFGKGGADAGTFFAGTTPHVRHFEYYATFRVALCFSEPETPMAGVLKVFFNGKVIWDRTGTGPYWRYPGFPRPRIYRGGRTQVPSVHEETDLGPGNVPAYRDVLSLLFDVVPLKDCGNNIPNVTATVAKQVTSTVLTRVHGTPRRMNSDEMVLDYLRGRLIAVGNASPIHGPGFALVVWDFQTGALIHHSEHSLSGIVSGSSASVDVDMGPFCWSRIWVGVAGTTTRYVSFNPETYFMEAMSPVISPNPLGFPDGVNHFNLTELTEAQPGGAFQAGPEVIFISGSAQYFHLGFFYTAAGFYNHHVDQSLGQAGMVVVDRGGHYWCMASSSTKANHHLVRFRLIFTGTSIDYFQVATYLIFTGTPFGSDNLARWRLAYSPGDNSLIIGGPGSFGSVLKFDIATSQVIAQSQNNVDGGGVGESQWRQGIITARTVPGLFQELPGTMFTQHSTTLYELDVRTLEVLNSWSLTTPNAGTPLGIIYDPIRHAVAFISAGGHQLGFIFLDRVKGAGTTVRAATTRLFRHAQLANSRFDDSALGATPMQGYALGRTMRVAEAMQFLRIGYAFDIVESGGKLVCRRRGRPAVATIPIGELAEGEHPGETGGRGIETSLTEEWLSSIDVPAQVKIRFHDRDRDYDRAAQEFRRPSRSGKKGPPAVIDLPIAFAGGISEARQCAEIWAAVAAAEAEPLVIRTGPWHIRLEAGDGIVLDYGEGRLRFVRLQSVMLGANWLIRANALPEDAEMFISDQVGVPGLNNTPKVIDISDICVMFESGGVGEPQGAAA